MHLEYEKKGLITKFDYEKIVNNNEISDVIIQKNYYFETQDNYFKNSNSALRVRAIKGTYELTLKVAKAIGSEEYNYFIGYDTFLNLINNFQIPQIITNHINEDVQLNSMIFFETRRNIIVFNNHKIEIDMTNFGSQHDYEIEVEAINMELATKIYYEFLAKNKITDMKSMPKIARYYIYNS